MPSFDFILGDAGSGKSRYIYSWLGEESFRHPEKKYYLFVPEQNTLKAQREIAKLSPCGGMLSLEVMSFQLLFYRVMDELGLEAPVLSDDMTTSLLLRKAALDAQRAGELRVYARKAFSKGFIEQLSTLIAEFFKYRISRDMLIEAAGLTRSELLSGKLCDIASIYGRFRSFLDSGSMVSGEMPEILMRHLAGSTLLSDSVIVFDGYTGFTPAQLCIIAEIISKAGRVRFSFTFPEGENPFHYDPADITDLWWLSRRNIAAVIDAASLVHVPLSDEGVMFMHSRKRHTEGVYVIEADDPTDELRKAAASVREKALFGGLRYARMAMVVSDMENYAGIVERELSSENIPYFSDVAEGAAGNPVVELLRAAFAMILGSYRYDDIMHFVRNPLLVLESGEREPVYEFDNALRKRGIRGRKRLRSILEEQDTWEHIASFVEAVFDMEDGLKAANNVAGMIEAPKRLLSDLGVYEKTAAWEEYLRESGFMREAAECTRFLGLTEEFLGKTKDILGGEAMSPEDFIRLTEACFTDMRGSLIPQTMDTLIVADLRRSRIEDIDVLYIVGANEGLLPGAPAGGGIFSDFERMELTQIGRSLPEERRFELAPDDRTDSSIQNFYLYLMINKPEKELVISYAGSGRDGRPMKPAGAIRELLSQAERFGEEESHISPRMGLRLLSDLVQKKKDGGALEKDLLRSLLEREDTGERAGMILKASSRMKKEAGLSARSAKLLYGGTLSGSVSMLETYESCPYSFFMSYALRLKEREDFDVEAIDIGNIFHSALNLVFTAAKEEGKSIGSMSEDELDGLCLRAADQALAEYRDHIMSMSGRNQLMAKRVKRILLRTVRTLRKQLSKGSFTSFGTELAYRHRSEAVRLTGVIDRVDIYRDHDTGRSLVEVIDYKSGDKKFDPVRVREGLDLQLAAYMDEALRLAEKENNVPGSAVPAGMFYYHLSDPVIKYQEIGDGEDIEEKIGAELRMRGAVASEREILSKIDSGLTEEGADSSVFRDTLKLSTAEFEELIKTAAERIRQDTGEILAGNIALRPYKYGSETPCKYCSFRALCGFDFRRGQGSYRIIGKDGESEV